MVSPTPPDEPAHHLPQHGTPLPDGTPLPGNESVDNPVVGLEGPMVPDEAIAQAAAAAMPVTPPNAAYVRRLRLTGVAVVVGILALDQALKLWVHYNMALGEEIRFAEWFRFHHTENNGMAFGLEWGGTAGKLGLTLFRLAAVSFLTVYIRSLTRRKTAPAAIIAWSFILAGAIGNIIDSVFYGVAFGYAPLLFGRVVDMLYFPLYAGYLPQWLGGGYMEFFQPIFNIADASISVGVGLMILNFRRIFPE